MAQRSLTRSQRVARALRAVSVCGAVRAGLHDDSRPQYGRVIYIAQCSLQMRMGTFRAYVFQDLVHKGYTVALAHGEIHRAKVLYTRIHSSCVTSETLRGCDCDCAKQLEGALEKIALHGAGILFYLIQEGRGVGYVAKARDRMLVQASNDELSTFAAYRALGLRKDYRDYENLASICHLLGVRAPFVLLTNNPDKLAALRELGLKIKRIEAIEFDPGFYNLAYLTSKAETGHLLKKPRLDASRRALPPEQVKPFTPHALRGAKRFIYSASYFLPMKPADGEVILSADASQRLQRNYGLEALRKGRSALLKDQETLSEGRLLLHVDRKEVGKLRDSHKDEELSRLLTMPYWFRVHAYYDVVTGQDFIVLVHGHARAGRIPLVRIHSEAIFDRFPLTDVANRNKLKQSAKAIVRHGHGIIVLLYNDGRGAGFGAHALDRMFHEAKHVKSSDESYNKLGVEYDSRDYEAALRLVHHHAPRGQVALLVNSMNRALRNGEFERAVRASGVTVTRRIPLAR